MNLQPQTNQPTRSNADASRIINFLSARLLNARPPAPGISICGPDEIAEDLPAQPPFGGTPSREKDDNQQPGNPAGEMRPIVDRD